MDSKNEAFEYLLLKFIHWYNKANQCQENDYGHFNLNNDFSLLKVIKLHYLTIVAGMRHENNRILLSTFDRFVAMPYGHVESGVYDYLKNNKSRLFSITNSRTTILDCANLEQTIISGVGSDIRDAIDRSVEHLKYTNGESFILLSGFELVDISHSLNSWRVTYESARTAGVGSKKVEKTLILADSLAYTKF